ncbi:MAG: lamin tail domain-containing protein [Akkermansiaceae bacterium]|nr:lamin tail domain-containing protein [Akkermansiaceae bacterium]
MAGPLVITELMYHPAAFESEFVEIMNISGQIVPLAGAEVSGIGFVFETGTPALDPGGIVVLSEIDPAAFRAAYNVPAEVAVYGPCPGRLDNGGERVRLRLPETTGVAGEPDLLVAVDTVIYSDDAPWPVSADGSGNSLERVDPLAYGGEPLNWRDSSNSGGTPGIAGPPSTDWRSAFFTEAELADPAISGVYADADLDGLANALEYLLGSDLRDGGSRRQPLAEGIRVDDGIYFELSFTLRDGVTEFAADLEQSHDLLSWSDASDALTLINTTPNGDGTRTLTYRGNNPITPESTLFFRLALVEL